MNLTPRVTAALRFGAGLLLAGATMASAQIRTLSNFVSNTLPANDDSFTGLVNIGFSANFFGTTYTQLYVNNNGNVTFNNPFGTFTPSSLTAPTSNPIIAPFFADVDTRGSGALPVTYGIGTLGGHTAFAVDWFHVGVYSTLPIYNTFQLVMIDLGSGNFNFEFNYSMINWETGQASGGDSNGLGGVSAYIGYNNGAATPTSFQLAGSGVNGAFLDSNLVSGLIHNELGTPFDGATMAGRYDFSAINGTVITPPPVTAPTPPPGLTAVPEPSTYGLMGSAALVGIAALRRRKAARAAV